jgi:hypothetical protein
MVGNIRDRFKAQGGGAMKKVAALCVAGVVAGVVGGVALAQVAGPNPPPATETPSAPCCISVMGCAAPCQNDANGESTEVLPVNVPWTTCPLVQLITPGSSLPGPCQPLPPTTCGVEVTWSKANCQGLATFMPWPESNCSQSPGC